MISARQLVKKPVELRLLGVPGCYGLHYLANLQAFVEEKSCSLNGIPQESPKQPVMSFGFGSIVAQLSAIGGCEAPKLSLLSDFI